MKKFWNDAGKNILLIYCGLYTFVTIVNSIVYLSDGIYEDPSGNWHEIDRAIIVLIGILAFAMCKHLKIRNIFLRLLAAYIPTILLAYGYMGLTTLREPLAASAYRDIFVNFTGMFLVVALITFLPNVIHRIRKKQ